MTLPRRKLGRTGLDICVLGLGAAPLGGLYRSVPDEVARTTIDTAYDGGVRYFDVAPFYGHGLAERRLGDALRRRGGDYLLSTKVGRLLKPARDGVTTRGMYEGALPFDIAYDYSYDGVMRSLEDSHQRLGLDRIDIVYIHDVNRRWHGDAVDERFAEVMAGGYRALDELRRAGLVRAVGVGVNDSSILMRFADAGDFDCFMLAGRYTLLEQSPLDDLLPLCEKRDISIVAAAPFNSGILATGARKNAKYFYGEASEEILSRTRRIEGVCRSFEVPIAAAAIQFPLRHPAVASVALGCSNSEEVQANISHLFRPVPAEFWRALKDEGLIRADAA
ncbi:aldo/keto reductase [Shinella sp. BYT-45]|uniref:aldo/keto reductase n=1 Tax=Shinella sp. BYT-45 TaxID=3377377 RepID=UPI003981627E